MSSQTTTNQTDQDCLYHIVVFYAIDSVSIARSRSGIFCNTLITNRLRLYVVVESATLFLVELFQILPDNHTRLFRHCMIL